LNREGFQIGAKRDSSCHWYEEASKIGPIGSSSLKNLVDEIAKAEKINPSYVSRVLRLTLLAPSIVEVILDGRQPAEMTLAGLMEPFPVGWREQLDVGFRQI